MLIGEVARRSGVSARMLRHYDRLGLVTPSGRTSGGYREYSGEDVARIFQVESLRSLGMSLEEAGRALDGGGVAPGELVDELAARARARIARERELLDLLERVASSRAGTWEGVLGQLGSDRSPGAADRDGDGAGGGRDLDATLRLVVLLRTAGEEYASARARVALRGGDLPPGPLAEAALAESDINAAGALRWALARSGAPDLDTIAAALDSTEPETRERAIRAAEGLPEALDLLRRGLADPAEEVRDRAALALAAPSRLDGISAADRRRRFTELLPALARMIARGRHDVDAAEALGRLAREAPARARAVRALEAELEDAPGRRRIAQALAELPGPAADAALARLAGDPEPGVSLTARAILQRRVGGAPG